MPISFDRTKVLYNLCRPEESLAPNDPRNVPIDACPGEVRGQPWAERLARRVRLSDDPACLLFTGLPGCGKSTELKRAMRIMESNDGCLPVYVDALDCFDLANPIDVPDVWAAIVNRVEEEVLKLEGKDAGEALKDGFLARLWKAMNRTDVSLKGAEYQIPEGPKLLLEMKARPDLRKKVRAILANQLPSFLKEAGDELVTLQARAKVKGRRSLVVVVDSLEKNRGIVENFHEVLVALERIFGQGAPYLRLPVHAIYTLPPALVPLLVGTSVDFLPMVKIRLRDGQPCSEGLEVMRRIILQRFSPDDLEALLGESWSHRIDEVIRFSGGYTREVVRLLRQVLVEPAFPVSDSGFKRLFNNIRGEYRQAIPADMYSLLAKVEESQFLELETEDARGKASRLLSLNAVLRYQNDSYWFRLHPAVEDLPGLKESRKASAS